MGSPRRFLLAAIVGLAMLAACDRKLEPFDPDEKPAPPDLSKIFPEGAERAQQAEAEAQAQAGMPTAPRGAPPMGAGAAPASGDPVSGTVEIADELTERVPRGGVLFVIARSEGGGPPLAVKRIVDPEFPLDFEIGPGDRMIEQMPFAGRLRLSARLDSDGNATTRSAGDLQGSLEAPVEPGAEGVRIRIDETL
jgi:cytochrome c-type biogenesis protein CcmH